MKALAADSIQAAIRAEGLDGWLFYSFRGSDPIAENILRLDNARLSTRAGSTLSRLLARHGRLSTRSNQRLWTACQGRRCYLPWQQLHQHLRDALGTARRIAMQYSPLNAIPYISRVDAGTVELVRSFGIEVVSSADLVQIFEAVWTDEQLQMLQSPDIKGASPWLDTFAPVK